MSVRQLHRFHGGVHPPEHKMASNGSRIEPAPLPPQLIIALSQHIGSPAEPLVAVGERVLKGQMIAQASGTLSAAVHASSSGTVLAIEPRPSAHPSGLAAPCIVIATDGEERWLERQPVPWRDWLAAGDVRAIRDYLRDMGVVGLGGAMFPSHLKLTGGALQTLVINGAECEPYISCDDRLMRERAGEIVAGIALLAELTQASEVLVGIEDNKPEAIEAMRLAAGGSAIDIVAVPTIYPSGGAKQLIRILTGKEVAAGVRSTDLGVQCFNVGTVYAAYRALEHGEPLISRIVTLTGTVAKPGNVEALLGTPLDFLLHHAGAHDEMEACIYGGPMMGFALPTLAAGLTKAGNCLLAKSQAILPRAPAEMPCIRCGACADACPAELQPMDLYWFARSKQFGRAQERNLFDCIECGACAYVCPSHIRLVDYYRYAKSEIWAAERDKQAADLARERHTFRQFRLERDKQEKAERLAARAAAAKQQAAGKAEAAAKTAQAATAVEQASAANASMPAGDTVAASKGAPSMDDKQAKIAAAMARAAARRAGTPATGDTPDPVLPSVAAAQNEPATPAPALTESAATPAGSDDAAALRAERIRQAMATAKARRTGTLAPPPADPKQQKREMEAARLAAMSVDERAALEAEKKAKIAAAMARVAAQRQGEETSAQRQSEDQPAQRGDEEKS
ncbi:electron transport complex subunit RsxC [Chitinolyticbacter albus]|uniref:electron transport complex subunit RsxC n=1 Tax=Chitinolyticbacter albus TaxID=2961951 RepID=UPI0021093A7D|nr:electron transport complex subunit RsxC [Chitinolyticbacter albus]